MMTGFMGTLGGAFLFLLAIALVVSSIGFIRYVFFISIGYGYSIAALALVCLVFAGGSASLLTRIEAVLLGIYGARLGTYLALREGKSAYQATQKWDGDRPADVAAGVKFSIWLTVSLLYVLMFMPTLYRFAAEARGLSDGFPVVSAIGVAVTAAGIAIETIADAQKNAAKKKSPSRFCDSGLYRYSRCPNYFGEILVWTGNILAGAPLMVGFVPWSLALVGFVSIILIMVGSARRLELKQEARYGNEGEFREYADRTPIVVPFVPVYSLKNAKLYLG